MPQIRNQQHEGKRKPYIWIGSIVLFLTFILHELIKDQLEENQKAFGTVFAFAAFGIMMVCNGLLQMFGEKQIKRAVLDLNDDIISLGSDFEGWIHFPSNPQSIKDAKFFVTIKCVRENFGGPGMTNKWRSETLWQDDGVVLAARDVRGLLVPVNFWIPEDCVGTDSQHPSKRVYWWLEVYCSTPGLDFTANFPLNVQRTALTVQAKINKLNAKPAAPKFSERDLKDTVVIQKPGEPKRLDIKPMRAPELNASIGLLGLLSLSAAALLSIVGLKATGTFAGLANPVNAMLAASGLFLMMVAIYNLLTSRSIKFLDSSLVVKMRVLLFGRTREIRWSEVEKVDVQSSGTQGTKSWYDVTVKTVKGPTRVVARQIENKVEAEWIKTQIVNSKPKAVKKAA